MHVGDSVKVCPGRPCGGLPWTLTSGRDPLLPACCQYTCPSPYPLGPAQVHLDKISRLQA